MAPQANCQTAIDIKSLVDELMASGERDQTDTRRSGCKIPKPTEQVKPADGPDVVRIGPYYHDPVHSMEPEKRKMLLEVILEDEEQQKAAILTRLFEAIHAIEKEAREHYVNCANRTRSAEFVRMLLLDGCYILGKLVLPAGCCPGRRRRSETGNPGAERQSAGTVSSQIGSSTTTSVAASPRDADAMKNIALVRNVFYLVDNQIPFCVLDTIHNVVHGGSSDSCSSTVVVVDTLTGHLRRHLENLRYSTVRIDTNKIVPWHLLHLLHMHFQPANKGGNNVTTNIGVVDHHVGAGLDNTSATNTIAVVYRWCTATQYHEAGVRFKKLQLDGTTSSILDVKLDGNTLRFPPLTVDDNTFTIMRNLMMLEHYNPEELGSHVTAYCLFMSQLTAESGAALLVKKGIIVHALPNDSDVAEMFAALCSGIIVDMDETKHNYLHRTRMELERLYKNRPMKWVALFRRRHFSNPLVAAALLAGIIGFVCELIQAIYSVKGNRPSK